MKAAEEAMKQALLAAYEDESDDDHDEDEKTDGTLSSFAITE